MAVYRLVQLLTGTGCVGEKESFLLSPWLEDNTGEDREQKSKSIATASLNSSKLETLLSGGMQKHLVCKCLATFPTHYHLSCVSDVGNQLRATERKLSRHGKSEALCGTQKWRLPKRLTHLTFALSTVRDFMTLCRVCSPALMFSLVAVNCSPSRLP